MKRAGLGVGLVASSTGAERAFQRANKDGGCPNMDALIVQLIERYCPELKGEPNRQ
jgi:hypothetical protein